MVYDKDFEEVISVTYFSIMVTEEIAGWLKPIKSRSEQ